MVVARTLGSPRSYLLSDESDVAASRSISSTSAFSCFFWTFSARRISRFKSGKYTVERPLHLGAALAASRESVRVDLAEPAEGTQSRERDGTAEERHARCGERHAEEQDEEHGRPLDLDVDDALDDE